MNIFLSWNLEADHFHHPSSTAPVQSIILALLNPWALPTCLPVWALPLPLSILRRAAAVQAPCLWVPPAQVLLSFPISLLLSTLLRMVYLPRSLIGIICFSVQNLPPLGDLLSPPSEASSTGHCTLLSYPPVSFTDLTRSEVTLLMDRPRGPCSPLPLESQHLDCGDSLCLFCCHVLTMLNFIWCLWSWKTQKAKISTLSPSFVFDKWFVCREPSFPKMT